MLSIQPFTGCTCYEKLTPVRVRPTISHGEQTCPVMFHSEVFILKIFSATIENAHGACAITVEEISTLDHEVFNYSMEGSILEAHGSVVQAEFSRA